MMRPDPLEWPEDYVWVHRRDGTITVLCHDQVQALYAGKIAPQTEAELAMVADRPWLRILTLTVGEYPVHITEGEALPKWADHWLRYWAEDNSDAI